jgi:hypothetical protein
MTPYPYSVVITTFDKRFEAYLIPLIAEIKLQRPQVEIIVTVNGPAKGVFNQEYRANLLKFCAQYPLVYPTIFPNFQSLAKMWNRGALTAIGSRSLVLNDDIKVMQAQGTSFFDNLERTLSEQEGSFRINGSFSHFILDKCELIEVGFFDERLLGLGEEDGDFFWRYHQRYQREIPNVELDLIENVQSDLADDGYTKGIRTAAKFNRDFMQNAKYKPTLFGGYRGMFDQRVKQVLEDQQQYPYERYYLDNKSKL